MKSLIDDYMHNYTAANGFAAAARVTIFEVGEDPRYVVVISEPDDPGYCGPSVTNNIEVIAAGVVMGHVLPSSATLFFEHYPASTRPGEPPMGGETFDRVEFANTEPAAVSRAGGWVVEFAGVRWRPSSRAEAEELIGGQFR